MKLPDMTDGRRLQGFIIRWGQIHFFQKGMYEKAIEELKITIAMEPDFVPAYNLLGKSYAIVNDFDQAEISFRNVISLAPELEEGYLNLGLLYRLKGDEAQGQILS